MRKRTQRAQGKPTDLAERLARSYATLLRGLSWIGSEGDDPFHAFSTPFAPKTKITPETFRAAAAIGPAWRVEVAPAAPWFAKMIQFFHDGGYGSEDDHAIEIVYTHLRAEMKATLQGPLCLASAHYAPKNGAGAFHKARYYVFGQLNEGGLAGLLAHSVET